MEDNTAKKSNLEICPNCLEPNRADLANCEFCGMPLHPDAVSETTEDVEPVIGTVPADNTTEIIKSDCADSEGAVADDTVETAEIPEPQPKKKQGKTWTYMMRGFGLYIIIYAITEAFRHVKIEDAQSRRLGLISDVIYLIAGCLMAWPMLKEYLEKRKEKQAVADQTAAGQVIEGVESADVEKDANVVETEEAVIEMADEIDVQQSDSEVPVKPQGTDSGE